MSLKNPIVAAFAVLGVLACVASRPMPTAAPEEPAPAPWAVEFHDEKAEKTELLVCLRPAVGKGMHCYEFGDFLKPMNAAGLDTSSSGSGEHRQDL